MITGGQTVGSYLVQSRIASGALGDVWQAYDTKRHRTVALRVLSHTPDADERVARLQHDIDVLCSIKHRSIATTCGIVRSDGVCAVVQELVSGATLAERLQAGPMLVDESLLVANAVAEALAAAHKAGVVHRDLKPGNIKLLPSGGLKVLDFGLAQIFEPAGASLGASAVPLQAAKLLAAARGSATYLSPEQVAGGVVDSRTDIWAFGCVLYEMLAGCPAFDGGDVTGTLTAIANAEPEWSRLPSTVPPVIMELLQRCLHKDPAARLDEIAMAAEAVSVAIRRQSDLDAFTRQSILDRLGDEDDRRAVAALESGAAFEGGADVIDRVLRELASLEQDARDKSALADLARTRSPRRTLIERWRRLLDRVRGTKRD